MNSDTHFTIGKNLSDAWAQLLLKAMALPNGKHLRHHTVFIPVYGQGQELLLQDIESQDIRALVDDQLEKFGKHQCHTVANTIFPVSIWQMASDRYQLYERYLELWDSGYLKTTHANRNGTYFQRLIAYPTHEGGRINQLEHIIRTYDDGNHRSSALQASIIAPAIDHTNSRQQGFPCLQHVHFTIYPDEGNLEVTGIYATQLILEKAYGNYLGLYRLGLFMSKEMGFKLTRIVCITSLLKRSAEHVSKTSLGALRSKLQEIVTTC